MKVLSIIFALALILGIAYIADLVESGMNAANEANKSNEQAERTNRTNGLRERIINFFMNY